MGISAALGEVALEHMFQRALARRMPPSEALSESQRTALQAPGDEGALPLLFELLAPAIAEAFGPNAEALDVRKKDRVDPRSGLALYREVESWARAFGINEFELYVGGRDTHSIVAFAGNPLGIVVGPLATNTFGPMVRARLAAEMYAASRGLSALHTHNESTVVAIVSAACRLAKVAPERIHLAGLPAVDRALTKAISRKVKNLLQEPCEQFLVEAKDVRPFIAAANQSRLRIGLLGGGDAQGLLIEQLGLTRTTIAAAAENDARVQDLFRFAFSQAYATAHNALRMRDDL
jgi:hypothetical protein